MLSIRHSVIGDVVFLLVVEILNSKGKCERNLIGKHNQEEDNIKVLAHMTVEAEKSQDFSLPAWRPRKASGVLCRPEVQGADGVASSLSLQVREPGVQTQT